MHSGACHPAVGAKVRGDRALVRAINELGGNAGQMLWHEQRAWASITFSGARHKMCWAFDGDEAVAHGESLIAQLPDNEFDVPCLLVADATVVAVEQRADPPRLVVELELLVLDEG